MNNGDWIRITSTNGRARATFHREKSHKRYPVKESDMARLNDAILRQECLDKIDTHSWLMADGMGAEVHIK